MTVFSTVAVRATIRIGNLVLFIDPVLWTRFFKGALALLLRRAGLNRSWTQDRPVPYAVSSAWKASDLRFLEKHLGCMPAAVIADYMFCTPAFSVVRAGTPTAIIMHDLFHARGGEGKDSVAIVTYAEEMEMLSRAETIFAIQDSERSFLEEHLPSRSTLLVPMPAHSVASPQPGLTNNILFVGSNTAPNSVGLRWFLDDVWPQIVRECPDCKLHVAGSVGRAFDSDPHPNVQFLGLVDSLDDLYRDAAIVISPLTFGSGLKIKLVEAMSKGKAIVATPTTLQGVEDTCSGSVICTSDPDEFAKAVIQLNGDQNARAQLADMALECARNSFSAQTVHRDLRSWATECMAEK